MSGKLIVFEGTDGSGKATQAQLFCAALDRRGVPYREIDFPRYGKPSAAMVEEYLAGNLGSNPDDVNAYAASLFYAMDRFASWKQDWGSFYEEGGLIVADRYTTSNAVHQASKLPPEQREDYLRWLYDLEYHLLGLPKPDLVIYLDMPTEIAEDLLRERARRTGTRADIHEQNQAYLRRCREGALDVARFSGWRVIPCGEDGGPRPAEQIHREIFALAEQLL